MKSFPSAYTNFNDKIFKIYGVKENFKSYDDGAVGEVVDIKRWRVIVKTGDGSVILTEVNLKIKTFKRVDIINGNVLKRR